MKTHAWKDLKTQKLAPEQIARSAARTQAMLAEMPLAELRRARDLSQATLAEALETTQPEVSKIERRTDMYISTLRRYIEAMGGALDIVARFPDGEVHVTQFHDLETAA